MYCYCIYNDHSIVPPYSYIVTCKDPYDGKEDADPQLHRRPPEWSVAKVLETAGAPITAAPAPMPAIQRLGLGNSVRRYAPFAVLLFPWSSA